MPNMIKDWKTFRELALELAKKGMLPVYGDFNNELEEVVVECIFQIQKQNIPNATLLINSDGGNSDCFTGIRGAMMHSGLTFTGIVMSRARSNGFRILQFCDKRKAMSNSELMFHWGRCTLDNGELSALMSGETWPISRVNTKMRVLAEEISARTAISLEELYTWALYERSFSAQVALQFNLVDEVIYDIPGNTDLANKLNATLIETEKPTSAKRS